MGIKKRILFYEQGIQWKSSHKSEQCEQQIHNIFVEENITIIFFFTNTIVRYNFFWKGKKLH